MIGVALVLVYFGLALLAAVVILQPDRFVVTRSAVIDAPPHVVFQHLNELRRWEGWSPWARIDPQAQGDYAGPAAGAGASYEWSGKKIGAGRMTIVDSRPNERVDIKLDFRKPFAGSNDVVFTLAPEAQTPSEGASWLTRAFGFGGAGGAKGRTKVTWTITGRNSFLGKARNLLMNCEKRTGAQFEQGLANLNAAVCG